MNVPLPFAIGVHVVFTICIFGPTSGIRATQFMDPTPPFES
jgi:hypothetical protein